MENNLTLAQSMALLDLSNGWAPDSEMLKELSKMDLVTGDGKLTRYGEYIVTLLPVPRAPKEDPTVWISSNGRHAPIEKLGTTHIINILNLILRNHNPQHYNDFQRQQCRNLVREAIERGIYVVPDFAAYCGDTNG